MRHLKLLTILLLATSYNICQAQQLETYRTVDRHCKDCTEMIFGSNGFELKDIRNSKEEIEIRFLVNSEHVSRSITVIKGSEGKFTASYYFQYFYNFPSMKNPDSVKGLKQWEPYPFKRFKVNELDLDSIVDRLVANKIYELPHQRDLVPNAGYYRHYGIETKVNGVVRQYYFGNLREFTAKYPDIHEFKSYNAIVAIFKEISSQYQLTLKTIKTK